MEGEKERGRGERGEKEWMGCEDTSIKTARLAVQG